MNNKSGTILQSRPSWTKEVDRKDPVLRYRPAARSYGHRSSQAGFRPLSPSPGFKTNTRDTSDYHAGILPEQFFTGPGRAWEFPSGAQRLMFAVLQDAVACWFRWYDCSTSRKRRLFQETRDWFWTQNPSGLYAFERICEVLNLDPAYIRRGLQHWHPGVAEQQLPSTARRPYVLTRRSGVPHTPTLHSSQFRPKKGKGVAKEKRGNPVP